MRYGLMTNHKMIWIHSYNGRISNWPVDGMTQLNLKRDKRRAYKVKQEPQLIKASGDDRRRPFIGGLSLHPRQHVLPPQGDVASHTCEHLFRYGDLKNGLEAIVFIDIGTKLPHRRDPCREREET